MDDVEEIDAPPGDAEGGARATLVVKCAGKGQPGPMEGKPVPSPCVVGDVLCVDGRGGDALLGSAVVDIGCETGIFLDGSVEGGAAVWNC